MVTVQAVGGGVLGSPSSGADALADQLMSRASGAFGFVDADVLGAALLELASGDPSLAADVETALAERLPLTDQAALARSSDKAASPTREGLHLSKDKYLAQAKDLWSGITPREKTGFSSNADVSRAAKAVASTPPPASTGDVVADRAVRDFVVDIARETARAPIGGRDQEYEKFLVIGRDPSGEPFVRRMGVVGKQGGIITSLPGETVVHQHYEGLAQSPNGGDSSSALNGKPGFVIGSDGRTVWEVGRIDGEVKVRTVRDGGASSGWRDFQAQPTR